MGRKQIERKILTIRKKLKPTTALFILNNRDIHFKKMDIKREQRNLRRFNRRKITLQNKINSLDLELKKLRKRK